MYVCIYIYTNFECLFYNCQIYINYPKRHIFLDQRFVEFYKSSTDCYKQKV